MVRTQLPLIGRDVGQLWVKPRKSLGLGPAKVKALRTNAAAPLFVIVRGSVVTVPMSLTPNSRSPVEASIAGAPAPTPVKPMLGDPPLVDSKMVALRVPIAIGSKLTINWQCVPDATTEGNGPHDPDSA